MDDLLVQQEEGRFIKEYGALSAWGGPPYPDLPGFPPPPEGFCPLPQTDGGTEPGGTPGIRRIESWFRPYGPGRKEVRPVPAGGKGGPYVTELIEQSRRGEYCSFRIRISRGFRHQIRCHLAWIGCPILNDDLYGGGASGSILALRAEALSFSDPLSGERKRYALTPLAGAGIF
jgi:23S rRNA pseudouridine1911/1915/1917 synthase